MPTNNYLAMTSRNENMMMAGTRVHWQLEPGLKLRLPGITLQ